MTTDTEPNNNNNNNKRKHSEIVADDQFHPPIVSAFNKHQIRPLIEGLIKLRHLNASFLQFAVPTIVLIGERSVGKTSVLESLTGLRFPCRKEYYTRVPVIIKFKHHPDPVPEYLVEYQSKSLVIDDESNICESVVSAMLEITGDSMSFSKVPVTLVVKRNGVPDLTIIDLPGITRVPVGGEPEDIFQQISGIIMEHIKPEQAVLLNVVPADVDLSTSESLRMSRQVDKALQRTLAVFTQCDRFPDEWSQRLVQDDFDISLLCVRNRVNNETFDEARDKEIQLFQNKIDTAAVGVSALSHEIIQTQFKVLVKALPDVLENLDASLRDLELKLGELPKAIQSSTDAFGVFSVMHKSLMISLEDSLLKRSFEFDEKKRCRTRLAGMLEELSKNLEEKGKCYEKFLVVETQLMEASKGLELPGTSPPWDLVLSLVDQRATSVAGVLKAFVEKALAYVQEVCIRIVMDACKGYPKLLDVLKKTTRRVFAEVKVKFLERLGEIIDMERLTAYTSDSAGYSDCLEDLKRKIQPKFSEAMAKRRVMVELERFGSVNVNHLFSVSENTRDEALDLKMAMAVYWDVVSKRLVDWCGMMLRLMMKKAIDEEMRREFVSGATGKDGGLLLELFAEAPEAGKKRQSLETSAKLMKECKESIEEAMNVLI